LAKLAQAWIVNAKKEIKEAWRTQVEGRAVGEQQLYWLHHCLRATETCCYEN